MFMLLFTMETSIRHHGLLTQWVIRRELPPPALERKPRRFIVLCP